MDRSLSHPARNRSHGHNSHGCAHVLGPKLPCASPDYLGISGQCPED